MASFLENVTAVCYELGIAAPSSLASTSDPQVLQIMALMNRTGTELLKAHDWTALQTEYIVTTVAPVVTTGNVTSGSAVVTGIPSTASLAADTFFAAGTYIPSSARIVSVDSATQVTLTEKATTTATGVSFTFSKDTYAMASDFDRFIDDTGWDRTNHWRLVGPQSPQFDQWQRSGIVTVGPRKRWRQVGKLPNVWRIWPPPASSDPIGTLVFEYISSEWALSGSTYSTALIADDDTAVFSDELLTLGTKYKFFAIKGFDYGELKVDYVDALSREKARDGGKPVLNMARRNFPFLISPANIPDSGFGNP